MDKYKDFDPYDLTNEQLDALVECLERRAAEHEQEAVERHKAEMQEEYNKKHCDKCGIYLSCADRRKRKCYRCGAKKEGL